MNPVIECNKHNATVSLNKLNTLIAEIDSKSELTKAQQMSVYLLSNMLNVNIKINRKYGGSDVDFWKNIEEQLGLNC